MKATDIGNNIIVNVEALQQRINKTTLCKECIESKIESKILDVLKYADKVRDKFASKVEQLPIRTEKRKKEYYERHKPSAEDILQSLMNCRRSRKFSWLDDCMAQPFNRIELETRGIATSVHATCECQQHVTEILPRETNNCTDYRRLSRWELNCQLVGGMQAIGCGGQHATNVLAHLGLPFCAKLHSDGFAKLQEDVGKAERLVTKEDMWSALQEEIGLTIEKYGDTCLRNGLVLIEGGFDMGWSKRSSGKRYDSQSGHCYLIGKRTGKIIACIVFCKVCRVCQAAEKRNEKPKEHTCMKNYEGASKSMESDAILRMCIEAPNNGYYIGTIISDDDTNMRAHLKHAQTNNKGKLPVSKFMQYDNNIVM